MGTVQARRKPFDSIKDHIQVGLAYLTDFKGVDVAIAKATNHVESPPEERYLRKIMVATSSTRPKADVVSCIRALFRRIRKTHSWTVALKTLIVIHRTMRESGPMFIEELYNVDHLYFFRVQEFKDDSSLIAEDCSKWITTYARFLEKRISLRWIVKYDNEAECLPRAGQGEDRGYSKNGDLDTGTLICKLSNLQSRFVSLTNCRHERTSAAMGTYIVQYSLVLVLKESFTMYSCMNDLMIELVHRFFEMSREEAIEAVRLYKAALKLAAELSDFYEFCRGVLPDINFQVPVFREPPRSFLMTMEEYVNEAPTMISHYMWRTLVRKESGTPAPEPSAESSISPSNQQQLHNTNTRSCCHCHCHCHCQCSNPLQQRFPLFLYLLLFMLAYKPIKD